MINRRNFLGGVAAATSVGLAGPLTQTAFGATGLNKADRVIVIGAGIVGASIAYNLAKRGCEVTVLEKSAPASQASGNSFAWINASWFDTPDSYLRLRTHSLNEYHRLANEVDLPIRWGGSLEWYDGEEAEQEIVSGVGRVQASGVPTWIINNARAKELEPGLTLAGERQIAWCSRDGAVNPEGVTWALLRRVAEHGGGLVYPANVTAIETEADGVRVVTDSDSYEADLVVCAAGAGTSDIAEMTNIGPDPMRTATPGIIVITEPMPPILNTIVYNQETHFHQLNDGRVLVGEKAGPPTTEQHDVLLQGRPNAYPTNELAEEHAARVFATASKYLPALSSAKASTVGVGWRPLPKDGLPIVGHAKEMPRLYFAAMHSGVTLAPIVGQLAAMEILDGVRINLLDDFRYERF